MNHTFTREQIKRIIIEELKRSNDEEAAEELLKDLIGLKEGDTDEFESKMRTARTFKKRLGLTSLFAAVAILFGDLSGLTSAQKDSIQPDLEKVQQVDSGTLEKFGVDLEAIKDPEGAARSRGAAYPTAELGLADLSNLNNAQRIDAAWKQIDDMVASGELKYEKARVSSPLPGGMATLDYGEIPPNLVMPNSLSTKDQYRAWLVQNVLEGDIKNLPKLRDFVYGNTGKWPSGNGEKKSRTADGAQVLPPEWTVAQDLYQDTLVSVVTDVSDSYKQADEETKQKILQANGVETPEQLEKMLNKMLYQAGVSPDSP